MIRNIFDQHNPHRFKFNFQTIIIKVKIINMSNTDYDEILNDIDALQEELTQIQNGK